MWYLVKSLLYEITPRSKKLRVLFLILLILASIALSFYHNRPAHAFTASQWGTTCSTPTYDYLARVKQIDSTFDTNKPYIVVDFPGQPWLMVYYSNVSITASLESQYRFTVNSGKRQIFSSFSNSSSIENASFGSFVENISCVVTAKNLTYAATWNIAQIPAATPVDVCPNIEGTQTAVPSGMQLQNGNCIIPAPTPTTPPAPTSDLTKDYMYSLAIKAASLGLAVFIAGWLIFQFRYRGA